IVEDGVAKLPDRTAFAGSVATADRLVRTMYALSGAPLHETIKMASLTPARLMKIDGRKGSLKVGKDADILLLDKELNVNAVMARGEMIK
ncbi:MAG: amidohydrolase family protein, partial [Oscillospiraceae bacterium]